MEIDKQKAKKRKWRISEKSLLGVAILFGAYGAYGGMKFFRHKTKHKLFTISLPLLVLGQTVFLVWAWLRWG